MIDTINAVVKQAYISVTMPRGLVFSYTSFDRSERSVNSNDGVVRTISTTEFDSCGRQHVDDHKHRQDAYEYTDANRQEGTGDRRQVVHTAARSLRDKLIESSSL